MTHRFVPAGIAAAAVLAASLVACAGGGSTTPSRPAPAGTGGVNAPSSSGKVSLSIAIPAGRKPAGTAREPLYVSPGLQTLEFYDGTTLIYSGTFSDTGNPQFSPTFTDTASTTSLTNGSCTNSSGATYVCTFTAAAAAGQHHFDVVTYGPVTAPSPIPTSLKREPRATASSAPSSVVLSEGELSMNVVPGTNAAQTITLFGVAYGAQWFGPQTASFDQTATISYEIDDATSSQIVTPGVYDNGPVTITASPPGIISFTPVSQTTPPSAHGVQTFDIQCTSSSGGDVTLTANAGTQPNTAFASGLTYSAGNYSNGTLGTRSFRCFGS